MRWNAAEVSVLVLRLADAGDRDGADDQHARARGGVAGVLLGHAAAEVADDGAPAHRVAAQVDGPAGDEGLILFQPALDLLEPLAPVDVAVADREVDVAARPVDVRDVVRVPARDVDGG